jgi:imidazolonepropionase-like amidohydrolase
MSHFDPTDEYVSMPQAGLSYPQILAALTTAPAARFGAAARSGRLAAGCVADVVVPEGDPAQDTRALARVRATVRGDASSPRARRADRGDQGFISPRCRWI